MEETRVDRWLWAVRLYKTRSMATDACRGGHVKVNGAPAKPAPMVRVGDRVVAHAHGRERIFEVVEGLDKRVSAPLAAAAIVDHSPPPPPRDLVAPAFVRDPATGRPTKRDRRQLDRFRSR
jgi:ribosome-associated heat shock protein Hsp15